MATSKSRSEDDKASLVVLPVELLGEIVDRIGWESLDRLWQCGSRVLNSKLSNPNCVKCLSNKNEQGVIGPWEEATIRRFQAIRCFALDLPSNSHFQLSVSFLQSLPSTLRELAIRKSDGVSRTSSSMKKANISPTILLDLFPQLESLSLYCAELKQDLLSNYRKFPSPLHRCFASPCSYPQPYWGFSIRFTPGTTHSRTHVYDGALLVRLGSSPFSLGVAHNRPIRCNDRKSNFRQNW